MIYAMGVYQCIGLLWILRLIKIYQLLWKKQILVVWFLRVLVSDRARRTVLQKHIYRTKVASTKSNV